MSGLQSIGTGIAKATNWKPAKWLGKKFEQDPEKALAMATVTSIILKDGIGCAMYVTQSLHNDKIPEKKRKFVAALDLTNGVLMIGAQILSFLAMRKYSGPIFEKIFSKSFNKISKANTISRMRMQDAHPYKKTVYDKMFGSVKDDALGLFKFVVDIAAATIVGKRVIVPLIATPLAKKVEKKMDAKKAHSAETGKPHDEPKQDTTAQKTEQQVQAQKLDIVSAPSDNAETLPKDTNLLSKYSK